MPKFDANVIVSNEFGSAAILSCVLYPKLESNPCGSAWIAESAGAPASPNTMRDREAAHDCRDESQRPDRLMRSQVLRVQHAEMFRHLLILAHRVRDARPCVHAGERGPDQRQEHRERLHQHEDASASRAEHRVANHDHHVANRSRRRRRTRHRIPTVKEVIRREILEQVANQSLHEE